MKCLAVIRRRIWRKRRAGRCRTARATTSRTPCVRSLPRRPASARRWSGASSTPRAPRRLSIASPRVFRCPRRPFPRRCAHPIRNKHVESILAYYICTIVLHADPIYILNYQQYSNLTPVIYCRSLESF